MGGRPRAATAKSSAETRLRVRRAAVAPELLMTARVRRPAAQPAACHRACERGGPGLRRAGVWGRLHRLLHPPSPQTCAQGMIYSMQFSPAENA